jgi:hypothetical protein
LNYLRDLDSEDLAWAVLPELFVSFPPDRASLFSGALDEDCLAEEEPLEDDCVAVAVLLCPEPWFELLTCEADPELLSAGLTETLLPWLPDDCLTD